MWKNSLISLPLNMMLTGGNSFLALMIFTKAQRSYLPVICLRRGGFWIWGAGTGLLAYFWYQHFPAAEYLLVDIADEMLKVARQRFAGLANVSYQILDYAEALPVQHFDVIISALSIHHLTDEEKERLFSRIYAKLPSGGLFVNYDQFCAEQPQINAWFNAYWENQLRASGLTAKDIELWQERRKLDKECSVEAEVAMLQAPAADFREVKCLYSCHKFSVIAAIK